jgi:hypothetical protein
MRNRGFWLMAGAAVTIEYALARRFVFRRWGATRDEAERALPGDDIVEHPRFSSTFAISIEAPAHEIWPWIAQFGQGRGGLYSYDWLENLFGCDIHSANRILPEHQHPQEGRSIRLVREGYPVDLRLEVAMIEAGRAMVLRSPGTRSQSLDSGMAWASWAFVLDPQADATTRLITRWRSDYAAGVVSRLMNGFGLEPVQFAMQRKMLLGIKERAESLASIAA